MHCKAGISRSVTVAAALVMRYLDVSDVEALEYLRNIRRNVNPKIGFLGLLQAINQELAVERQKKKNNLKVSIPPETKKSAQ